jgi:tetratricopeptide (TPR) repeat protein
VLEDSLRRHRAAFPEGHLRSAEALVALGAVLRDRGEHAQAEPLLREALEIRQRAIKTPDERLAEAQRELGVCLAASGRRDEAERLLLSSYDTVAAKPGAERHAARSAGALATFYKRIGNPAQAAKYSR